MRRDIGRNRVSQRHINQTGPFPEATPRHQRETTQIYAEQKGARGAADKPRDRQRGRMVNNGPKPQKTWGQSAIASV